MKLFIGGSELKEQFSEGYDIVDDIEDADAVLILPGGLCTFYELFVAIGKKKRTIIYNKDMYYAPLLKNLYNAYSEGKIKEVPSEYVEIESEEYVIKEKLEEIKNGKINNGKTGKLL